MISITGMAEYEAFSLEELRWNYVQRCTDDESEGAPLPSAAAIRLHVAMDRWARTSAAAAAAAKPGDFDLATSFTNAQPMHGWSLQHCARELWQNLRDGVASSFGAGPLVPTFSIDQPVMAELLRTLGAAKPAAEPLLGHIALTWGDVSVGSVDASDASALIFRQRFAVLHPRHLLLASTKGADSAGAHGEGFKVAINFLLRHGFTITYTMNGQCWRFVHQPLHCPDILTMVVEMRPNCVASSELVVEVRGPGAGGLFRLEQDWDLVHAASIAAVPTVGVVEGTFPIVPVPGDAAAAPATAAVTGSTEDVIDGAALIVPVRLPVPAAPLTLRTHREALSVNAMLAGRVYCRSLFVNMDRGLGVLGLTANLDFELQRDRQTLPYSLPFIVETALKSMVLLHGQASPSVVAMCEHLLGAFRGGTALYDYAPRLRELLRAHVAWQKGCDPASVLFFGDDKRFGELEGLGLVLHPHAGELADRVNLSDVLLKRVSRLADWEPKPGGQEAARVGWLAALVGTATKFAGWARFALCIKVLPDTRVSFLRLEVADSRCYLSSRLVVDPIGWRIAAVLLSTEITPFVKREDQHILSHLFASFMDNPIALTRDGWTPPPPLPQAEGGPMKPSPGGAGAPTDNALGGATTWTSEMLQMAETEEGEAGVSRPCPPCDLESTQSHDARAAVFIPTCKGATLAFTAPPHRAFVEPPPECSCIPRISSIVARSVMVHGVLRTLYVETAVLSEAEAGPLDVVIRALPVLLPRFDAIIRR